MAAVSAAVLFGYLASVGPVYYVGHRLAISHPLFFRALGEWCRPAESVAARDPFYWKYLRWCADKGLDAGLEEWSAKRSPHSTPR